MWTCLINVDMSDQCRHFDTNFWHVACSTWPLDTWMFCFGSYVEIGITRGGASRFHRVALPRAAIVLARWAKSPSLRHPTDDQDIESNACVSPYLLLQHVKKPPIRVHLFQGIPLVGTRPVLTRLGNDLQNAFDQNLTSHFSKAYLRHIVVSRKACKVHFR